MSSYGALNTILELGWVLISPGGIDWAIFLYTNTRIVEKNKLMKLAGQSTLLFIFFHGFPDLKKFTSNSNFLARKFKFFLANNFFFEFFAKLKIISFFGSNFDVFFWMIAFEICCFVINKKWHFLLRTKFLGKKMFLVWIFLKKKNWTITANQKILIFR